MLIWAILLPKPVLTVYFYFDLQMSLTTEGIDCGSD